MTKRQLLTAEHQAAVKAMTIQQRQAVERFVAAVIMGRGVAEEEGGPVEGSAYRCLPAIIGLEAGGEYIQVPELNPRSAQEAAEWGLHSARADG
jgi:hypothetical protein